MIAATLFSGIGSPEVAMPHWHWAWCAEIAPFPCAVLAARHPQCPNLGDVTNADFVERALAIAKPDVVCFGSPCQDFSVAGRRLGLDGVRGNLSLLALAVVERIRPRWFVFENVPGLLSNWSGAEDGPHEAGAEWDTVENSDFAAFLGSVDELGYSLAWTVLDAQYFALAQRRERLFAVGHIGDWPHPAAILLECESMFGDSPTRAPAGQDVAGALGAGSARSGERVGRREAAANHLITAYGGSNTTGPIDVATACRAKGGTGHGDFESETFVLGPNDTADPISSNEGRTYTHEGENNFRLHNVVAFDTTQITSPDNRCQPKDGDPCHPLPSHGHAPALATLSAIRRLTPRECERLQGFPDDYTLVTYRKRPAADGPRYKALGNAMPVPVMRWMLARIEEMDAKVRP